MKTIEAALLDTVIKNDELKSTIQLYSNYVDYDITRKCYVLTNESDVVVCNEEYLEDYIDAGFEVFGETEVSEMLADLIYRAEHS
ncbi:hypothetical protein [Brevibacillus brevis]|uniref:hypothetical protein n=1 Tax=Brevibacillus brevis TaxID=1393 RepID=UPI0007D898CE|nr:hypothetical protein [Brevibacillus brevis]